MIEESVLRTTDDHKVAFRRWLHGIIILDVWWGVVMLDHMSQISNLDIVCEPSSVGESLSVYHGMGVLRIIIEFKSMSLLSCGSSSCNGLVWNKNRELTYEVTSETMSVSHYIYIYSVCVHCLWPNDFLFGSLCKESRVTRTPTLFRLSWCNRDRGSKLFY